VRRRTCNSLKYGERRSLRCNQGILWNQKCLLERVLAGKHGAAYTVGKDKPARIRRKFPILLGGIFLEVDVLFHEIVTTTHELVIERAIGPKETHEGAMNRTIPSQREEALRPAAEANRGPKASKVCEVLQTRLCAGLMLVKNRRIRAPLVGRVRNESK